MIIGFTGTRQEDLVSSERKIELMKFVSLRLNDIDLVVHGGAIGMDRYFHGLCWHIKLPIKIRHGSNKIIYSKYLMLGDLTRKEVEEIDPEPYLKRNKKIVDDCDILIAVPIDPNNEELKSGTWSTIRYARKKNKEVVII